MHDVNHVNEFFDKPGKPGILFSRFDGTLYVLYYSFTLYCFVYYYYFGNILIIKSTEHTVEF